ncbi:proline-specific peptidase [Wolfiporia cocos MD-104 SS10]|uniref:Proline-specific peptidase n=1 Tax=Wolfiporia cocos (strain MD-104) TaxID=742152 RepID=A0A2H3J4M9_WOLCO|nr:proline-specific peptidase [Wolfiporia cocos MD-104 SS10]
MANPSAPAKEGLAPFVHQGETYQTWYKVFGDLTDRTRTPLVGLHGGPGLAHNYLLPLSDLTATASIPVVLYDQIGGVGQRSSYFTDKPHSFWNIDLFIDELESLLAYLSIQDNFILLGHSWGGQLAAEFELRRQPAGLKKIILSNTYSAAAMWGKSTGQLLSAMPKEVQEGMAAGWKNRKLLGPAMKQFQAKHGCTVQPPPEEFWGPINRVFEEDYTPVVEQEMYSSDSELIHWDITDKLHLIRQPVLLINGEADVAQDFVCRSIFERVRKIKWRTFARSSHTPMLEEREEYVKEVLAFLES